MCMHLCLCSYPVYTLAGPNGKHVDLSKKDLDLNCLAIFDSLSTHEFLAIPEKILRILKNFLVYDYSRCCCSSFTSPHLSSLISHLSLQIASPPPSTVRFQEWNLISVDGSVISRSHPNTKSMTDPDSDPLLSSLKLEVFCDATITHDVTAHLWVPRYEEAEAPD